MNGLVDLRSLIVATQVEGDNFRATHDTNLARIGEHGRRKRRLSRSNRQKVARQPFTKLKQSDNWKSLSRKTIRAKIGRGMVRSAWVVL